jgi:arylsulfatase A-like enzyme
MNKKNVIILMIDGGRFDRTLYSNTFNKLKNSSAFFSKSITYGPHTIAAMHAVFSGTYGNRTGTNSYWSTFKFRKENFKTLTEYLHDLEYYTLADVVNKLVIPQQGFDEFLIHDELNDDLTLRHCNFLDDMKKKNSEGKDFFLYLQYSNIHTGIMNEVLKIYDNFSLEYFSNKEKNGHRYDKLFNNAEKYLETIIEKIKNLELDKNSIILIMSDHGISIGEKIGERAYGAFCYDYTLRTFTYFIYPEVKPIEIKQQIRTIDFMPTILDYLQIPFSEEYEKIDGESLLPLINGHLTEEKYAFSETGNPLQEKRPPEQPNTKSIRTSKWKLIFNEYDGTKELYNLELDPSEKNNLIGKNLEIEAIFWKEIQQYL